MGYRIRERLVVAAVAVAMAWTAMAAPAVATTAADASGTCGTIVIAVGLSRGAPLDQTVVGTVCTPRTWAPGIHRIDILVHGASYNRNYWDWQVQPGTYSYVARTLASGRATFAYDRLGAGQSSHPLSALVTTAADAYILHELIGRLTASGYGRIDVVGHSFGSVVAIDEAAAYRDVNALVVTGLLHSQGSGLATVAATFYPNTLDPEFGLPSNLDAGYLTTLPATRGKSFYSASADPSVIAYDEAHKDVISGTELAAGVAEAELPALTNPSRLVAAPVLVLDGQQDGIFCGLLVDCAHPASVLATETSFYSAASSISVVMIPGTGHDVALHPSAPQSFPSIDAWITAH